MPEVYIVQSILGGKGAILELELYRKWVQQIGITQLLGGFKHFFIFPPYLGKWSNFTNIFEMGWNHQLDWERPFFGTPGKSLPGTNLNEFATEWKRVNESKNS